MTRSQLLSLSCNILGSIYPRLILENASATLCKHGQPFVLRNDRHVVRQTTESFQSIGAHQKFDNFLKNNLGKGTTIDFDVGEQFWYYSPSRSSNNVSNILLTAVSKIPRYGQQSAINLATDSSPRYGQQSAINLATDSSPRYGQQSSLRTAVLATDSSLL
ncbi:hypothetical protein ACJJTC_002386 [Scirpophaga incertulas]